MSDGTATDPLVLVVMGVSGSGKSTIGQRLAVRLGCEFIEGDDLHPADNVAKMRAGTPLTDADRQPWLRELAAWIARRVRSGLGAVVACSALKRSYRDQLAGGHDEVFFVHLAATKDAIAQRLANRDHEFMPAHLLDSQFADLEPLQADERGATIDVMRARGDVMADALAAVEAAAP